MLHNRKKKTAHKLYLSEASHLALERESIRLSLPMSVVVDLLIRKHLVVEDNDVQ